jgi:N-acetylglutamate synthase/N-acetylornithine aminotransferase
MECPKLATSISKEEIIKTNAALSERAKKLPKARVRKTMNDISVDSLPS